MHHGPALDNTRQSILGDPTLSQNVYLGARPDLPMSPWRLPQLEMPETGGSVGTGDELLDFTQADMGWDFDFSTMDLEAFFSVYQPNNAPMY